MSVCDYLTTFKGVNSINDDLLLNNLESNFKMYLDWSFLNIGAFQNVTSAQTGTIYGTDNPHSTLLLVDDPQYTDGQVWQGQRKDWVYESGISFNGVSPVPISGVYVNNTYYPYSSGNFTIDYPLGRIIFDNPVSKSATVKTNYSYRYVQVYRASDSPWFNIMQYSSLENNNPDIIQTDSGDWSIGGNHRVQLPAILVESTTKARSRPYEIGNNTLIVEQDLVLHVLAENKNDRNKLLDIIRLQQDATIALFDNNLISKNDRFPLDYNGDINPSGLNYPNLLCNYLYRKCWIKNIVFFEIDSIHHNFHQGQARVTLEIISL